MEGANRKGDPNILHEELGIAEGPLANVHA